MKIAYISSEISPVAKVGGLADVTLGLSRAIQSLENQTIAILPKHKSLKTDYLDHLKPLEKNFTVLFANKPYEVQIWEAKLHGVQIYFLDSISPHSFFNRQNIYGYKDDVLRYVFFSLASLEFISREFQDMDIIHINEWQTALVAPLYKEIYHSKLNAKIILTIHNMNYQGITNASILSKVGLDQLKCMDIARDPKKTSKLNLMKAGIYFSDFITTVSPRYYQEIQNSTFGKGLEKAVLESSHKMTGILNGIDYEIWNPELDESLINKYSVSSIEKKKACKDFLRKLLNMPLDTPGPLVTCVCRLVPQKGIQMIKQAISYASKNNAQFILFGSSPIEKIQKDFDILKETYKDNPNIQFIFESYNEELSHQIYAGADMIICPSLFEPCGLTQLIALQYGTVPIVRETGGLADTVFDVDKTNLGNGFTYTCPSKLGIETALKRAFKLYLENPSLWHEVVRSGMNMDFSWKASAKKYLEIYENVTQKAKDPTTLT